MKKPRDIKNYISAEDAALGLEDMARSLRERATSRHLVKYSVSLSYWHPDWEKTDSQGGLVGIKYANRPKGDK